MRRIRRELRGHAGVPIVSYPGWSGERLEVSRRAIEKYEAIRQRGRDWLAAHKLPKITPLGPDSEMIGVPEGIINAAAMEWLAECGYAERTSRNIIEYLCGRRLGLALLEGEDVFWQMAIQNCSERQEASRMFTILGLIRVAEENCRGKGHLVALFVPPDVTIEWDHACSWRRLEYPRND